MDPEIPRWALALGVVLVIAASVTLFFLLRAVDQLEEEEVADTPVPAGEIQYPVRVLDPDEVAWALEPPAPGAFPLLPDRKGKLRRLRLLYGGWSRDGVLRARWRGRARQFRVAPENIRWRHPVDGMF